MIINGVAGREHVWSLQHEIGIVLLLILASAHMSLLHAGPNTLGRNTIHLLVLVHVLAGSQRDLRLGEWLTNLLMYLTHHESVGLLRGKFTCEDGLGNVYGSLLVDDNWLNVTVTFYWSDIIFVLTKVQRSSHMLHPRVGRCLIMRRRRRQTAPSMLFEWGVMQLFRSNTFIVLPITPATNGTSFLES